MDPIFMAAVLFITPALQFVVVELDGRLIARALKSKMLSLLVQQLINIALKIWVVKQRETFCKQ